MTRAGRRWLASLVAIVIVLVAFVALWSASKARCWTIVGSVTCRIETDRPMVALSFDDGPTDLGVDAVLPVLDRYGAHATFFVIGEEAAARPELVRRLLAAGQEIGNHGWVHRRIFDLLPGTAAREIARTDAVLRAEGARPRLFRPPYGKKLTGLPLAVERTGYHMVTWDFEEPTTGDPRAYADQVLAQARPGSIILIHAMYRANRTARAALPMILDGLQQRGIDVVTVSTLITNANQAHSAGDAVRDLG